jgi:hypothetical protein
VGWGRKDGLISWDDEPWRLSISKCGLRKRVRRASWTVCTVALLPEPWKASKVGLTGPLFEPLGGSLGVRYVAFWEDDIVVVDGWVGKRVVCLFFQALLTLSLIGVSLV